MALSAVVKLGTNATSGTSVGASPSRDVQVGEFIVVMLTERDWGVSTLVDNSSQAGTANTYTQDAAYTAIDPNAYIYSCKLTRKILSTDTITATFGGSGLCSISVLALPDANTSAQLDKTANTHSGSSSSTYTSSAVSTTAQADEYAVGVAVFSTATVAPGTITADSPWTLQYSPGATGYGAAHGSQVLSATGTPAFTGGWGVTEDGAQSGVIATYKGTVSGGSDATVAAVVAAATASVVAPPLPRPVNPFSEANLRM